MMRNIVLIALVLTMLGAAAVYFFSDATGAPEDLLNFQGPYLVAMVALLVVFLGSMLYKRPAFREVVFSVLVWGGIGLALVAVYGFKDDLETVARRTIAVLVPGMTVAEGGGSNAVMVARAGDSHFHVTARVGKTNVEFLVDTGASTIVLTHDDAKRIGIDVDRLVYSIPVSTANGIAQVAAVRLDSVRIGGIQQRDVEAFVAAKGVLRTNLLGMSFLNRLSSWEMRGDRLILRP